MTTFNDFPISSAILKSLEKMQITTPTPVQRETLPLALKGFDVLASARTGSGKTIAYLIPLIMKLLDNPQATALILAPTRELASQVQQSLHQLTHGSSSLKSVLLIGGASMFKQLSELKRRPRILIGTPGRINDHLSRRTLNLQSTCFLVIDEADRMLDMGFGIQLDRIAEHLTSENRQSLLFSATFPPNIEKLSQKYLKDPQRVSIDSSIQIPTKIQQETVQIKTADKRKHLVEELNKREGSIIVFVRTRRKAESMSIELNEEGHKTDAMHGDLPQRKREHVLRGFRDSRSRILIATDVAARGLDIPHVMHVINYDLPECPEDYVHRIGRTGRAGADGFALSLVSPEDRSKWRAISQLLDPKKEKEASVEYGRRQTSKSRFGHWQDDRPRRPKPFDKRNSRFDRPERGSFKGPSQQEGFNKKRFDRPEDGSSTGPAQEGFKKKRFGRPEQGSFNASSQEGFKKKRFAGRSRFR